MTHPFDTHPSDQELSDFVDNPGSDDVRTHLAGCERCRRELQALQSVIAWTAADTPSRPSAATWSAIVGQIHRPGGDRRQLRAHALRSCVPRALTPRRLTVVGLAACLVLAVIPLARSRMSSRSAPANASRVGSAVPDSIAGGPPMGSATVRPVAAGGTNDAYVAEVARLESLLDAGRGRLQPSTVSALRASINTIDRAIREADEALRLDPANQDVASQAEEMRRHKLRALRAAVTLASSST